MSKPTRKQLKKRVAYLERVVCVLCDQMLDAETVSKYIVAAAAAQTQAPAPAPDAPLWEREQ